MTQPDLSLCAVCGEPAQFTDADPGANPVSYDARHLPEHFRGRAEAGQMPLQDGSTKDELMEKAQELDIEGRSTMTKAQLQTAVAAMEATELARERNAPRVPGVRPTGGPTSPDRRRPEPRPEPTEPRRPARLTPEAEAVEQQYATDSGQAELEGGEMVDAPVVVPEVHDHAVETAGDEEPKKTSRKGSRKK